jgi:SAM-dependent methyltransferase
MRRDAFFYQLAYRRRKPRWDTGKPRPELQDLVGTGGHALDLGCGTGTDAIYLAQHGWQVVGVDFVPEAIATANERARSAGATAATFVVGDVTRLREVGVSGLFDLVIDIGCYHGIPAGRRDAYVMEVAAVTRPGADFYLAGVSHPPALWRLAGARGITIEEIRKPFGPYFDLVDKQAIGNVGRAGEFVRYHLVRK